MLDAKFDRNREPSCSFPTTNIFPMSENTQTNVSSCASSEGPPSLEYAFLQIMPPVRATFAAEQDHTGRGESKDVLGSSIGYGTTNTHLAEGNPKRISLKETHARCQQSICWNPEFRAGGQFRAGSNCLKWKGLANHCRGQHREGEA